MRPHITQRDENCPLRVTVECSSEGAAENKIWAVFTNYNQGKDLQNMVSRLLL